MADMAGAVRPATSAMAGRLALPAAPQRWAPQRLSEAQLNYTAALVVFVLYSNDALIFIGRGTIVTTALYGLTYLTLLFLTFRAGWRVLEGALAAWPLLVLYGLVTVSALWSFSPTAALADTPARLLSALLGFYVGATLSVRGIIVFMAIGCVGLVLANLVGVAVVPTARGDPNSAWPDTWRGLHNQKNAMGGAMAMSALICSYGAIITRGRLRLVLAGTVPLALFMLIMSQSISALLIGLVTAGIGALAVFARHAVAPWLVLLGIITASIAAVGYLLIATGASDAIFEALGRRPTMSGRLPIWTVAWSYIEQRPFLGWGHDFWDPDAPRLQAFARHPLIRHYPHYAHNGYVDTMIDMGLVGLAVLLWVVMVYARNLLALALARPDAYDLAILGVGVVYLLMSNFTEGRFLDRGGLWFLFVATMVRTSLLLVEVRRRAQARSLPSMTTLARGVPPR